MASPSTPPERARRRRAPVLLTVGVIAVLIAAGTMVLRTRASPRDNDGGHKPVEAVVLQRFGAPGEIRLASYKGHPMVINYWASWCTFCIAEMPGFQRAYERVGRDVAFIGVDVLDQLDAAKQLRNATGVKYTLATDRDASVFQQLGGKLGMPTTFFVDRDGFVVERYVGPLTVAELNKRLQKHFGI